jgi:ankyrin repeat protein
MIIQYYERYHNLSVNDIDQFKQNPLHIACASQHVNLANYLIKTKKISLYEQDFNGNTCLHMAAKAGLSRVCWNIVKQAGKRIINIQNGGHQCAHDLIASDTSNM